MTTCMGKSCSFGLLYVSCVKVYECVCVCARAFSPFGFEGGISDLIVIIPDHCLSIYIFIAKCAFWENLK